jgi:DNA-binding transcriptional ArsR family regulator
MLRNIETVEAAMPRAHELELYRRQAEIAKALANPTRLRILGRIGGGEVSHAALLADLGVTKTNLSQHLAVLRRSGVVTVRREGVHVHYRLAFPEIKELCGTMREVRAKHLSAAGRQARMLARRVG